MNQVKKKGKIREFIEGVVTALLIAGFLRAFIFEAYKIPTGSMVPTLMPGDHIFVNKFVYGPRIPFTKIRLFDFKEPKRGDVAVFMYPEDEDINFIKRIIGLPGDKISVKKNELFINGAKVEHLPVAFKGTEGGKRIMTDNERFPFINIIPHWEEYELFIEKIGDVTHLTQYVANIHRENQEIVVPADKYFVMGDNRDDSKDSREWGFVPRDNLKGTAMFIWFPWDKYYGGIRWRDFAKWIR